MTEQAILHERTDGVLVATRIERETISQEPRPMTKAAEKRARQVAHPRKETDSERGLRERREQGP